MSAACLFSHTLTEGISEANLFFRLLLFKTNRLSIQKSCFFRNLEPLNKLPNFVECEVSLLFNVNELYYNSTRANDIQGLSDDSN
jgi:hypothetical protein